MRCADVPAILRGGYVRNVLVEVRIMHSLVGCCRSLVGKIDSNDMNSVRVVGCSSPAGKVECDDMDALQGVVSDMSPEIGRAGRMKSLECGDVAPASAITSQVGIVGGVAEGRSE
jgi:hypothetical protein